MFQKCLGLSGIWSKQENKWQCLTKSVIFMDLFWRRIYFSRSHQSKLLCMQICVYTVLFIFLNFAVCHWRIFALVWQLLTTAEGNNRQKVDQSLNCVKHAKPQLTTTWRPMFRMDFGINRVLTGADWAIRLMAASSKGDHILVQIYYDKLWLK